MWTRRSLEKELLDLGADYYTPEEYAHCQKKLLTINHFLGIYHGTKRLLLRLSPNKVLDIGCGAGNFIKRLSKCLPHTEFIGIDTSLDAIQLANENPKHKVKFLCQSWQYTLSVENIDVILLTLVCHHLTDNEIVQVLMDINRYCPKSQVIINDLHRHRLAEFFFKCISPFFNNRLISHDGLISIRRAFKKSDWLLLLDKAQIKHYKIQWCLPFRWRVTIWNP